MGAVTVLFCAPVFADDKKADKIDAAKIVGKWENKNKKENVKIEFAKDGTVTFTYKDGGKELNVSQKYKVEGDKLVLIEEVFGEKVTITTIITKLTDTELVTKDEKSGKEETLVRIKGK